MRKAFQKIRGALITSLLTFSVIATSAVFPLSANAATYGNDTEENYTIDRAQLGGYIKPSVKVVPIEEDQYAKSSPVLHDGLSTDNFWSTMSSSYYGSQLTGNAKTLYENMEREAAALMAYDGDFKRYDEKLGIYDGDAKYSGMTKEEAMNIAVCFEEDHPQYFFMWGVTVSYYKENDTSGVIHFSIIDKYKKGTDRLAMKEKLKKKITEITSVAKKEKTAYDKEKYIHDYIVNNTEYDTVSKGLDEQKMDSALIDRKSVCAGYASAFQALCNKVGIETIAVTSESHKWVEVRLDGKWYAVDVTWDDPIPIGIGSKSDTVSYQCFNISDEELQKIDAEQNKDSHKCKEIWDKTFNRPQCVSGTYDPTTAIPENPKGDTDHDTKTDTEPGKQPDTNTDTEPGKQPDTNTDTEPGKQPDTNTDTEPGKQPDTNTDTEPGKQPDTEPDTQPENEPHVKYRTHVENKGWQDYVSDGDFAGTIGKSLRLEAMNIKLDTGDLKGGIEYSTHIQNIGWQDWKKNGELTGTTGQSLRLEAIKIRLTGEIADKYNIFYCVHAQNLGWLNWAKNGEASGTAGYSYRLEAISILLLPKEQTQKPYKPMPQKLPGAQDGNYYPLVSYKTHVQNIGWQDYVKDGELAGTTGRSLRLEGLKIKLEDQEYKGDIVYKTHVENIGWQKPVKNDAMAGTQGKSLRLEAVTIDLTGEMAEHYNVYYRTHVQNIGWTGWAKNGAKCGSEGKALRLEGLEVKLVPKGTNLNPSNAKVFYEG